MPVTEDGRIIPSFDPNDFTDEAILDDVKRMQAYLEKQAGKPIDPEDCPVDSDPFISQETMDKLEEEMCQPDAPTKVVLPPEEEITITDQTKCVESGIDAIKKASEDVEKLTEELSDLSELVQKIQEWLYNLEPVYYYNKARFKASDVKNSEVDSLESKTERFIELRTIEFPALMAEFRLFTSAVKLEVTANLVNVINVGFHYHWTDDIVKSEYLTTDEKDYLLKKIGLMFKIEDYNEKRDANGYLYKKYYSLFETPEESFFTLEERGLTNTTRNAFQMDKFDKIPVDTSQYIEVKGSKQIFYVGDNERKYSDGKTLYERYQDFYINLFPNELYPRAERKYEKDVRNTIGYKTILKTIEFIGKREGQCFNRSSDTHKRSKEFVNKYEGVQNTIRRLKLRISNIKKKLKKEEIIKELKKELKKRGSACSDMFNLDGDVTVPDNSNIDGNSSYLNPFGRDPNLPDYTKLCYWVKFCELATIYNATSPYPDLKNPLSFRYWPVGITIPTPAKLIKIPFPTVFVPLMVVSLNIGTFVLIFAQTGIFPALEILFLANDGSKNFMLAASVNAIKNGRVIGSENFGFNIDSEVELRTNFVNTLKIFEVPFINPQEIIEGLKIKKERLEGKIISDASQKIEEKYNISKKIDDGIDIEDVINKWRDTLLDKISEIPDRELGYKIKNTDELINDLKLMLNDVDWPVFTFPEEMKEISGDLEVQKMIDLVRDLLNTKVGLMTRPDNLRDLIKNIIIEHYDDSELQEVLKKIPDEISFEDEINKLQEKVDNFSENVNEKRDNAKKRYEEEKEHQKEKLESNLEKFENLKKYMQELVDWCVDNLNKNIWKNDGLNQALMLLQTTNLFHPFDCEPSLDIKIPNFLDIDSFKILANIINSAISGLTMIQIRSLLPNGVTSIRKSQFLNLFLDILLNVVPPIPLIDIKGTGEMLNSQITSIIKTINEVMIPLSTITIDQVKDILINEIKKKLGLPIKIDTKYFVDKIVDYSISYIYSYIEDMAKLYDQFTEMKVTTATIKSILYSNVNRIFDIASDEMKPYIELYRQFKKLYNTVKAIKEANIDFNVTEAAVNAKETLKKLATRPVMAVVWEKIKKELGLDKIVHDPTLAQMAFEALKEIAPLTEYHLVGSLCAFGGDKAKSLIRVLHPISLGEDLPPYERLKLNNPLFVIFLDGFCNEAKKLNGFDENYL